MTLTFTPTHKKEEFWYAYVGDIRKIEILQISGLMNAEKQRQNNLSKDQKQSVFLYLLQRSGQKKKLPNGIARDAAAHFQISTRLVTKIWTKGREGSPENAHEILKSFSP